MLKYKLYKLLRKNKLISQKKYERKTRKYTKEYLTIATSPYFNEKWYSKRYKVPAKKAVSHYLKAGFKEGNNPSKLFDNNYYFSAHPDILFAEMNPLLHYEVAGKSENRKISRAINDNNFSASCSTDATVLLFSHELSLTGAPIALLNMAKSLVKQGINPIIISPEHGDLEADIKASNIPYIVEPRLFFKLNKKDKGLYKFLSSFKLIVFNTIVTLRYAQYFKDIPAKKICWVHDGDFGYSCMNQIPNFDIKDAFSYMDKIYSVGHYSKSFTDQYLPADKLEKSDIFLYGIDEYISPKEENKETNSKHVSFGIFGTCCERKGQDTFLKAIKDLPLDIKKNCTFKVVGRIGDDEFSKKVKDLAKGENIVFAGQLSHEETIKEMKNTDVIVCPSLDDPMPIVCTEAMMLHKPVICSNCTGTSAFIKDGENSFLLNMHSDNLTDIIIKVYNSRDKLKKIGDEWNKVFQYNFTQEKFDIAVKDLLQNLNIKTRETCSIIISTVASIDAPYFEYSSPSFQKKIGENTGNILICNYGGKRLDYDLDYSSRMNFGTDRYMILAANSLRSYNHTGLQFDKWFDFLEKLDRPLNIVGLGAQATLEDMNPASYAKTLSENMVKWISMIADRCVSVGVRGEFTADVLKEIGIKNVDVVGCPTWFVHGENQPIISKKEWSTNLKPAFHTAWDPYSDWHVAWHKSILDNMLKLNDPKFVMQSEFGFVPYYVANKDLLQFTTKFTKEQFEESAEAVRKHFGLTEFDVYQNDKIRNMLEMFSSISKWEEFIKTRDFSFGFRIHGSVISIKNGVPAICVVSDSRTYELCSFLKIPFIRVDQIASSDLDIQKIYEEADYSELNKQYPKLLKNYISFLEKNGIAHKF